MWNPFRIFEKITKDLTAELPVKKQENGICPRCGAKDCISQEQFVKKYVDVSTNGQVRAQPSGILKTCRARQQLNAAKQFKLGKRYDL